MVLHWKNINSEIMWYHSKFYTISSLANFVCHVAKKEESFPWKYAIHSLETRVQNDQIYYVFSTHLMRNAFLVLSRWLKSHRNMIHPKIPFAQTELCGTVHMCLRVIRYEFYSVEEAAMRKQLVSWEFASVMSNITSLFISKLCISYLIVTKG